MSKSMNKFVLFVFTTVFLQLERFPSTNGLPTSNSNYVTSNKGSFENDNSIERIHNSFESKYLTRNCTGGKVYKISDPKDLFALEDELTCIFRAAVSTNKVPEGPMFGDTINIANLHFFNRLSTSIWTGKLTEKVICNGTERFLGWNKIHGEPHFPFVATIGKVNDVLNIHSMDDNNGDVDTVIIDYTRDIHKACPDFYEMVQQNKETLVIQKPGWNKHFFPLAPIVDMIRFVGRQSDGGGIYLGKMFVKDVFSSDEVVGDFAYFIVINYDKGVNPEFKTGDALPPLDKDFKYRVRGIFDLAVHLAPFDNFFYEPIHTTMTLCKEIFKSTRGIINYTMDRCFGSSEEIERLNKMFEDALPHSNFSISIKNENDLDSHHNKLSYFLLSESENSEHSHYNEL